MRAIPRVNTSSGWPGPRPREEEPDAGERALRTFHSNQQELPEERGLRGLLIIAAPNNAESPECLFCSIQHTKKSQAFLNYPVFF